ncbi:MAG: hypothetical protein IKR72_02360 [Bacteroidales bacterium]|nr:hypothetical protein [Bacteroidales bacterium]
MASVFTKVIKKEEILWEFLYADCTRKISDHLADITKEKVIFKVPKNREMAELQAINLQKQKDKKLRCPS